MCVGEWSRRPWYNSTFVHGRLVTSSLVIRQWRSRVGRWLSQSWHSTAEQSTTTTTRPRRHKLSSQAVVANTIMLQRTHITTLRSTPQQQWVGAAVWRHVSIESLLSLSDWLITSPLTLTTLIYSYINITWTFIFVSCYGYKLHLFDKIHSYKSCVFCFKFYMLVYMCVLADNKIIIILLTTLTTTTTATICHIRVVVYYCNALNSHYILLSLNK